MTDHLATLTPPQVHGWYRRLAAQMAAHLVDDGGVLVTPLAVLLLTRYLDGQQSGVFQFDAPGYLKSASQTQDVIQYHRDVFLSSKKARIGDSERYAGVVPRLEGKRPYTRWDPATQLNMSYESLVEIGGSMTEIARIQLTGTPQERDLFTALRGFQLRSEVSVSGERYEEPGEWAGAWITFETWQCKVKDRYDFDYDEYLTLPNPDYGLQSANAVRPQDEKIRVYHRNAKRMEDAGLAAPYDLESRPWVPEAKYLARARVAAQY